MYVYGGFEVDSDIDFGNLSLEDWHHGSRRVYETSNNLYQLDLHSSLQEVSMKVIPGTVDSPVGEGSLVILKKDGLCLMSIGGTESDIWLYTDKSYDSLNCGIDEK